MTPLSILRGARELLADEARWWDRTGDNFETSAFAIDIVGTVVDPWDPRAVRWTIAGALAKVSGERWVGERPKRHEVSQALNTAHDLANRASYEVEEWWTHSKALKSLDLAIVDSIALDATIGAVSR